MRFLAKPFVLVSVLILPLFISNDGANGQTNPISDAYVILDSTGVKIVSCTYVLVLEDTNSIDHIEVKLGASAKDTTYLVHHELTYDVTAGLPSGWAYSRTGNKVTLNVGEMDKINTYFGSVRIKASGNWSDPYKFISQLTF